MRITLLVLTWNEIEGMRTIMPQIRKEWCDEIIVVDAGSTDGTVEYSRRQGYQAYVQPEPGLGAAYIEGMKHVTGDIVITFSPDANSDPARIPALIEKMKEGYDMVIVSRYLDWAHSEDDDWVTRFGNWMFTKLFNLMFRTSITDMLVIFRAFRSNLVSELRVDTKSIPWQTQLFVRTVRAGKRIAEIPGNEAKRIGSARKMRPLRNGWVELVMMWKEFFRTQGPVE